MHEYSLVEALLRQVAREAALRRAVAVRRVEVRLGDASGVEPALFATAFDALRGATLCRDATLAITRVPVAWRCVACEALVPDGERLACPACGGGARLAAGDELMLDRVELEVDDV